MPRSVCGDIEGIQTEIRSFCRLWGAAAQTTDIEEDEPDALAAKAGYERAFISLIERQKTNPSLRSIFDLCTAVDIGPWVFMRRVDKAANFELPA